VQFFVHPPKPVVAYDKIDGITFKNNLINNQNTDFKKLGGLETTSFELEKIGEYIFVPKGLENTELYTGFEFETIQTDLLGNVRSEKNCVGAICQSVANDLNILDTQKYGASWYTGEAKKSEPQILTANTDANDFASKIKEAKSGDIIELAAGATYQISSSLVINKSITVLSSDENNMAQIIYSGAENTPVFEMHPKGNLTLKNVKLTGKKSQYAFANLRENMSSLYNLYVDNCEISNFEYILKAYKQSFSDEISFTNSSFQNCTNGIELSEETNDKGDYNVEFLTIDNCQFEYIKKNVIDYYRGGYDESTIGGNLMVTNSSFTKCGGQEENGILLNTRGIINVNISKNTFKNNPVKLVALLWGAKNNTHSDNEIINSGKIVVEENLKLKLMY
jgi:poly(beta-D-mannuronate) lyase